MNAGLRHKLQIAVWVFAGTIGTPRSRCFTALWVWLGRPEWLCAVA